MQRLYSTPLRVYLLLALLAVAGVYSGLKLPISLFPNSTKPTVVVTISYGGSTAEAFLNQFGIQLESQLKEISDGTLEVERVEAEYSSSTASFFVHFKWGASAKAALNEVQNVVNALGSRLPVESRDSISVNSHSDNTGFFALSFFSAKRDLNELYEMLEPIFVPKLSVVKEALNPELYNPSQSEIRIELNPEALASLRLLPRDIEAALTSVLESHSGGTVSMGTQRLAIHLPRRALSVDDLGTIMIPIPSGKAVHLADISKIDLGPAKNQHRIFKTNGSESLILFATPRTGGNIKKMSEDILNVVKSTLPSLPSDIQYKTLVDPSEFIRSAVSNVVHEVSLAALLAVAILFLFIGSLRNVITAAIEIPLSIVLAFILMKWFGMNLNLISLGGLALAAGMNVDASVVVMENIFRHFEIHRTPMTFQARLQILTDAVKEVRFAVIASTIASLVVFLPLAFTSDLTYAILGDLAKAVVFSHGFSAIVALILVPTVRLHLMKSEGIPRGHSSPAEKYIRRLESGYSHLLARFVSMPRVKWSVYVGLLGLLSLLITLVIPRLPKEIVGLPDTDWLILSVNPKDNTHVSEMEVQADEIERVLKEEYPNLIDYTFTQIEGAGHASIMCRLKQKKRMRTLWKLMETKFANTPLTRYRVRPWNPSELPLPDPPHFLLTVRGNDTQNNFEVAEEISVLLREEKVFPRVWTNPSTWRGSEINLRPPAEQWSLLKKHSLQIGDVADLVRVATDGRKIGQIPIKERATDIKLHFPFEYVGSPEDIGSIPVGIDSKIVPLKAIVEITTVPAEPEKFRQNQRELYEVSARRNLGEEAEIKESQERATKIVTKWQTEKGRDHAGVTLLNEDPAKELTQAISELTTAVGMSILLIFVTLVIQFGSLIEPLLVLVSVPLGFIGVLLSLFIFQSTLSLNSALGVILLNGIAVANSIILVDFIKRLVSSGLSPREAAVEAARKRLRPILITSLTTVLGMLPIALGFGEGGRILQPLGIAVSGGLWISMLLTLFLVPALQVSYLEQSARGFIFKLKPLSWFSNFWNKRTSGAE